MVLGLLPCNRTIFTFLKNKIKIEANKTSIRFAIQHGNMQIP